MQELKIRDGDCLLLIDVQNDFCSGGALAVPDAEAILPVIEELAGMFPTIVATQDWHPAGHSSFASSHENCQPFQSLQLAYGEQTLWPDHCIQGSHGAAFHERLPIDAAQLIVRKGFRQAIDSYSAFFENDHQTTTGLSGYLRERGIRRVFCAGLALDYCVRFSALDAVNQGFETVVLEAACRGIDMDGSNEAAREQMRKAGVSLIS